jgi:hypothetical protein
LKILKNININRKLNSYFKKECSKNYKETICYYSPDVIDLYNIYLPYLDNSFVYIVLSS